MTTEYKIWVEAPVIGKFVAKRFKMDTWESDDNRVAREVKKVEDMLRHKHPRVRVWSEKLGAS